MYVLLAFMVSCSAYLPLLARRRRDDEQGIQPSHLTRGLALLAGIAYFGFGMWLIGKISMVPV